MLFPFRLAAGLLVLVLSGLPIFAQVNAKAVARQLDAGSFDALESLWARHVDGPFSVYDWADNLDDIFSGIGLPYEAPEEQWEKRLVRHQEWVAAHPDSLAAALALATYYERYAWHGRGTGFASTVTDEGWRLFKERKARSLAILEALPASQQDSFAAHLVYAHVLLSDGKTFADGYQHLLRAINLQPNYAYSYELGAYFMMPRWFGRPGDAEKFTRLMADQLGGDAGDVIYARTMGALAYQVEDEFSAGCQPDKNRVLKGYRLLFETDTSSHWGHVARATGVFARLGDWENTRALILRAGPNSLYTQWLGWDNYSEWLKRSGAAAELAEINRLEDAGDLAAVEKRLAALTEPGEINPWLVQFYLRRQMKEAYATQPRTHPLDAVVNNANLNQVADYAQLYATFGDFTRAAPLAETFDAKRGHNLIGKMIRYGASLYSGDPQMIEQARSALAAMKSNRPNYQTAIRFVRGEIAVDDIARTPFAGDEYIGQAAYVIALRCHELGRPDLARAIILAATSGPILPADYALLSSLLRHPPASMKP
jgi:hypothetical protein